MSEITVQIKKAGQTMSFDPQEWPIEMYAEALRLGAEAMLNTKQSKVKTPKAQLEMTPELAKEERDSAMKIAQANLEAIMANKFKVGRKATAASKVSREVTTEALRLARNTVKDAIKAAGEKISHVKASDITSAARDLIAQDPEYLVKAKENLEANALKPKQKSKEELEAYVAKLVDPALVTKAKEKAAADKAKSAGIISSTQAGLVKGRKKPSEATAH
jgi:hypothetical protein